MFLAMQSRLLRGFPKLIYTILIYTRLTFDGQLTVSAQERDQRTVPKLCPQFRIDARLSAEEDWILTQWDGTMMHKQTPSARFRKFLKKHGLKVRKFHALRHTSATLLLYSGVNIRQVQSRLGHGNITTTQRYLHAIKGADEEAVNALQNLLITQHKASEDAKQKAE